VSNRKIKCRTINASLATGNNCELGKVEHGIASEGRRLYGAAVFQFPVEMLSIVRDGIPERGVPWSGLQRYCYAKFPP
jgi:hypothetical protein